MPLVLYNTLTRCKEPFEPLDPSQVRMYVCGPTVYDLAHIGNARAVVVFDQLYRLLRHEYGESHVKYVRNITDIDDKIIDAARANNEPISALTERTTKLFHDDMAALGALPPDVEPRCTAHVPQMIAMIEKLVAQGHAYAAEGHVLFAVGSWPRYGRLSRRSRQELLAGARVEVAPYKRDPGDFVLWKPSAPEQPGWDSAWGRGRPGWHIECSAMSEAHLGEHFDIHGGGLDLIFPHHENELAQSEAAHDGRPFVNLWMHNGFLSVDATKMSKSLGNFVTVHELLQHSKDTEKTGQAIRLALLSTHYRDPLDWTDERLEEASQTLTRWYRALNLPPWTRATDRGGKSALEVSLESLEFRDWSENAIPPRPTDEVQAALADDLNTPLAIAQLHEQVNAIYREQDLIARKHLEVAFMSSARYLGLMAGSPLGWLQSGPAEWVAGVKRRVAARENARKERRFVEADRIRDDLAAEGVVLEDRPDGTTDWRSLI